MADTFRVKAQNDNEHWFIECNGVRYVLTEQDSIGHSSLRWKRDEDRWITVELVPVEHAQVPDKFEYKGVAARFLHFGPLYAQNWADCDFWGTWYGYDVWYYHREDSPDCGSIIARWGEQACDYASTNVRHMLPGLTDPEYLLRDYTYDPPVVMPWMQWIWSHSKSNDYHRAWLMALATQGINLLVKRA